MKKVISAVASVFILLVFSFGVCLAADGATKEECMAKCKEVASIAKEKGLDAAVQAVMSPNGPYVWKDSYVFLVSTEGVVLAHPASPKMNGQNAMGWKDANGKLHVAEYVALGNEKGEGWVKYMWMVPETKQIKPKETYVYRVPGMNVIALAGVYVYE